MAYSFPPDVQDLISRRMAVGKYSTEDDVLRDALWALAEEQGDLVAVQEAIAELRAGDAGIPLSHAFARIDA